MKRRARIPLSRKILYALAPTVLLLATLEIGSRVAFYRSRAGTATALGEAISIGRARRSAVLRERKRRELAAFKAEIAGAPDALYAPEGRKLLERFAARYEESFATLARAVREDSGRLFVLYIPSRSEAAPPPSEAFCRPFFRDLAARHGAEFVDATDAILAHPVEATTLLPADDHLSRFGNRIVAGELARRLADLAPLPSRYDGDPVVCGDLEPGGRIWEIVDTMPYFVEVGRHGFRMKADLEIPKTRLRVLCLGDSFTFGPYLANHDAYPEILSAMEPRIEAVNAGVAGYTILDEAGLYLEKARRIAPDAVVLQVLDNDLFGLMWFKRNEYDRKRARHEPTEPEREFIEGVVEANRARGTAPARSGG